MDRSQPIQRGRPVSGLEAAHANEYFEQFLNGSSLKHILGYYRGLIDYLHLKPNVFLSFYPKLRANLTSWKAKALWKKIDARATHKCYLKGKAATNTRVLIIGGGPCGLRTAIEAQLLGAKVVVVEKRDRFSRNNVLHLWPFVIEDLRMLGAKKFFGKFCAGAIDHISIRRLQCILLKVALLLGVEVHTEVSFEKLIEPNATEKTGWRAEIKPSDHPVSQYEFDVIIGADGKRNTLQGFTRKEFRGKLAIAITANFINKKTEAEARVEEISGVAFIFNQKFFKDLQEATRIDLENIVYYKDDTHYFVMTAKKPSLIEKGVIKQDLADTEKLLAPENVDRAALEAYAIEAANFSTNYQMPDLEFAVNHYGQPDIAMFDFTSMFAADNASKVVERNGYRLLMILVGDSLLEPFWPTGSGCARGFLSSLDAAWAIRSWSLGTLTPLDVLAERESIYRLLAQTTPDNLNKDWKSYTLEPSTRYPNLNKSVVMPHQTVGLFDTDNPASIERMKRNAQERPNEVPKKRRRGNVDNEVLLNWISEQLRNQEDITVTDIGSVFKDGKILCAIIHHYRPDLIDYSAIKDDDPAKNNQLAFDILEKELGIPPIMTGEEITNTEDYLTMATYLSQVYDTFRGEIPHIKQPKLELPESNKRSEVSFKTIKTSNFQPVVPSQQPSRPSSRHKRHADAMITNKAPSLDRKTRKRRTLEKIGASVEERQKMLEEIASNRAERQNRKRQQRKLQTEQFVKSMQMLQANARDPLPFEDYSIFLYRQTAPKFEDRVKDLEKQFTYIPDYENKMPNLTSRTAGADEDLAARIKSFENKLRETQPVEKKPKDLLRAIGKIETSDWNIKEIEKKIKENKMGKPSKVYDKEKVPKWSKEQFLARQTKMEKQHLDRQDSAEAKFADIDRSIKNLDLKLKEGNIRELGQNKVASITEKLVSKVPQESKPIEKTNTRPVVLPSQGGSEFCHFCGKRVYLMERLSAEGRFFHHGCFKCQYCNTQLRLGSYAFDRDGLYDNKFFCIHHFGMVGEPSVTKVIRKPSQRQPGRSPEKKPEITGVDLLDRVETPERAEFANLSTGNASSDQEESINQMDEDEWTDKNFGASCAEMDDSDDDSSSLSDTDSEDEDAFDDALEEPVTKEGTMKWADRWKNSYSRKRRDSDSNGYSSSDQSSYYENSSDDDDSETATEGEEEIRARELRKQEVRVEPPIVQTDTGTDTEVKSSFNLTKIPDILSSHNRLNINDVNSNRSSDNISVNSTDFNSAESGDLDLNMNKTGSETNVRDTEKDNIIIGKLTITPNVDDKNNSNAKNNTDLKSSPLARSATAGTLSSKKPLRNFVLPPKESRKSFGAEFMPKFKPAEPEPLLIIKRTPSKISLPKEVGKPKVAVNTNVLDTKKYFGVPVKKVTPKKSLQRSETVAAPPRQPLVKQKSLPETSEEKKDAKTFNFEPEDSDLKDIDNYIEDLLANEEELQKPIDPRKYSLRPETPEKSEDEKVSSSIEDLLKALETETKVTDEVIEEKPDEKIEDLLTWMEGLDHDTKDRKVYRSFSDVKYKHLERALKSPQRSDSIVNKIPRNNLTFFEQHLSGKGIPKESSDDSDDTNRINKPSLKRSKTEINFGRKNQPRSSVDLDIPRKVNIKKMLKKFESTEQDDTARKERSKSPIKNLPKRNSFASFRSANDSPNTDDITNKKYLPRPKPIKGTIEKFESEPKIFKKPSYKKSEPSTTKSADWSLNVKRTNEDTLRDLEKFVEATIHSIGNKYDPKDETTSEKNEWHAKVTVTTLPNYPTIEDSKRRTENEINSTNTKELEQNYETASETTSAVTDNQPLPHDFSKAVASTDTSLVEDDIEKNVNKEIITHNASITDDNTKSEADMPHDFSRAVEDTSISIEEDLAKQENLKHENIYLEDDKGPIFQLKGDSSDENEENRTEDLCSNFAKIENYSCSSDTSSYENILNPSEKNDDKNSLRQSIPKASAEDLSEEEEGDFLKVTKNVIPEPAELYAVVNKNKQFDNVDSSTSALPFQGVNSEQSEHIGANKNLPDISSNYKGHLAVVDKPQLQNAVLGYISNNDSSLPQRPIRQKSIEPKIPSKNNSTGSPVLPPRHVMRQIEDQNLIQPVRPQRKRSATVSPMPTRKVSFGESQLKPKPDKDKSSSTSNLDVKKEVVASYTLPTVQTVDKSKIVSDETSSESSSEIQNSATEISTDSEFAHDDPTPTREIPAIVLNDFNVTKTRGSGGTTAKKIQVTSGYLQRPTNGRSKKPDIELKLKPLVPSAPTIKKPAHILLPRTEGYALNRTQSTGGIAAKVSLELKKKYLLGETAPGTIQKSGSASTLDSKFKTFHTNISDCQKLLKPAKEISASMQTFCNKLNERHSPILSPQSSMINLENDKKEEVVKETEPPPPDVTNVTSNNVDLTSNNASDNKVPEPEPYVFQNESEGRPRSPVHETSIVVPEIDWSKKNQSQSSDSLCTSSSDNEIVTTPNHQFENIPRVEVHEVHDDDDIPPDSLCVVETNIEKPGQVDNNYSLHSEPSKSITSEKKTLNQPKSLPDLESMLPDIHKSLHVNLSKAEKKMSPDFDNTSVKNSSGLSSPDSGAEQATTALTETELSDWARDGIVSDDFEDGEFDFNQESEEPCNKNKEFDTNVKIAKMPEFDDTGHVCGKEKQMKDLRNKTIITETMNSILSANLDNIEFMDTGTETSSDDGVGNSQDGYVLFKNEDDFAEDSLNPNINDIVEATNVHIDEKYEPKNTGYCILATEDKPYGTVTKLKSSDLEKIKQKQTPAEHEEDSLMIIETGTTTEENTCSDSTVKNITEISVDKTPVEENRIENDSSHKQKLEERLAKVKEEMALKEQSLYKKQVDKKEALVDNNIEFEEHCQRLQSKVEFGNVKDSIDIRKSRRKSKSDSPQKPDLIQEEKSSPLQSSKSFAPNLASPKTPDILYKKEILQKERDVNQKLIQEMVMNKMKAENKSLERKKRNKQISPGLNTSSPHILAKSATTDVSQTIKDNYNRNSTYSTGSSTYTTPDVLLTTNLIPLQNSQSINTMSDINSSVDIFSTPLSSVKEQSNRPLSVYACTTERKMDEIRSTQPLKNSENCSMPDIRKNLFSDEFVTPKAPPRLHRLNDEANKTAEKLKQDARARAKLLSNEELGLSPEEKLLKLREKITKRGKENEILDLHVPESIESLTERKNSNLYSNDSLNKRKNNSFKRSKSSEYGEQTSNSKPLSCKNNGEYNREPPVRTKSVSEFPKNFTIAQSTDKQIDSKKICKSDPNLLDTVYVKPKKKSKDRERRKSITKLISTFFTKKSPSSSNSKSLFSKLSPKSKDISKGIVNEEPVRRRSLSEIERVATTPPPIPPLPLNYTIKDESSDGEHDGKKQGRSSCDTLDKSGMLENSTSSLAGRKTSKSARKLTRQAQLKRHRMAQEIQRKLEETEVKTRELETRGVLVEKALRGEDNGECHKDESELLQEWFDLMRDRTELRRYEKELMIRAQELELEDRHARLQHELRERLENNEQKTEEDLKVEESIINEMMEIVSKRDSLIAVIEEDRLRCSIKRRCSAPPLFTISSPSANDPWRLSFFACLLLMLAYLFWVFLALYVCLTISS